MANNKSSSKHKHKKKHRHPQSDDESSGSESSSAPAGAPGRKTEGELKTENRNAILQRSRMWQTVGSDDEEDRDQNSEKAGGKEETSSPGKHGRHHKHHENGRKSDREKHRSRSRSKDRHDGHRNGPSASKERHEGRGRKRNREDDEREEARGKGRDTSAGSSASSSSDDSDGDSISSSGSSTSGSSANRSDGSVDDRSRSRSKGHRSSKYDSHGRDRKKADDKKRAKKKRRSSADSGHKKRRGGGGSSNRKEKKKRRDRSKDDSKKSSSSKSKKKKRSNDKDRDSKKKDRKSKDKAKGAPGFGTVNMAGAVDQDAYGKNGVLREADYFNKQREFEMWMMEHKKIFDTGGMPKWETKQYFREYMEDFNTCTLPHEKFIDLEKWEMAEYNRKKASEAKRRASGDALSMREDEMEMNLKKRKAREAANAKYDSLVKASIRGSKRESMQNQDLLRAEMQNAYKTGDMERVKRIEKRLEPDEMEGWR